MRLRCGEHGGRIERRQLAHGHSGPAVAHLDSQHRLIGPGERAHQRRNVLRGARQPERPERPLEPGEVAIEERDATLAHPHGFDETVARRLHPANI